MSWFTRSKPDKPYIDGTEESPRAKTRNERRNTLRQSIVFAMFGALMFCSKLLLEALPNIHMLGMFTMLLTIVYRRRALVPIYIFVFMYGLFVGFDVWWIPYLYIWTLLWGVTMLLPRRMPDKIAAVVYPFVCALHGLAYGTLYAPVQALIYNLGLKGMFAWIAAGFPFDLIHAEGNFALGLLILPLSKLLLKLEGRYRT